MRDDMFQIFAKINGKWQHVAYKFDSDSVVSMIKEILDDHKDNRVHVQYLYLPDAHKIDMVNDLVNSA